MGIRSENAQALWSWKGEAEWADTKAGIKYNKATLQKIFNKANSAKGVSLEVLKQAEIVLGNLIRDEEYLKKIREIRDEAQK